MTGADFAAFGDAMADLALGIGARRMDSDRVKAYWDELTEFGLEDVLAAVRLAKREAKRFLPSVGQLRECVRRAQNERVYRVSPNTVAAMDQNEIYCRECEDTGWLSEARLVPAGVSEHYLPGATRLYARPCSCRPANPIYAHKRAMERCKTTPSEAS